MTVSAVDARYALDDLFAVLDSEDWERVISHLDPDAELADELTGTWLRGRDAVARYLRAQKGIVTDIVSQPEEVSAHDLGGGAWLMTFNFTQRYMLVGSEHRQRMTGCCVLALDAEGWRLRVYHLGGPGGELTRDRRGEAAAPVDAAVPADGPGAVDRVGSAAPGARPGLGDLIRAHRMRRGLSVRALAENAGLSPSFVSQLERSRTDPTLGSLRQLAGALSVSAADLIAEMEEVVPGVVLGRAEDREVIEPDHTGVRIERVRASSRARLRAELRRYDATLMLAGESGSHEHDEFIYVIRGGAEIASGHGRASLGSGDSVLVCAGTAHEFRPLPGGEVEILVVGHDD